jgi:hypothetical protein
VVGVRRARADPVRMVRSLVVCVVAMLGVVTAPAAARAAVPIDYAGYNRLADGVWAGVDDRCAGRAQVVPVGVIGGDDSVLGSAVGVWDGTCTYEVRTDLDPYEACVITVHERGHLAGYRPVDPVDEWHDRHGLMATNPVDELPDPRQMSGRPPYAPCARLVGLSFTREMAEDAVLRRWPVRTLRCRVARRVCAGTTAAGRRARWTVGFDAAWTVVAHRRGGPLG